MFDKELVLSLIIQVQAWLLKIEKRAEGIRKPEDFIYSEEGEEKFDSICMLFIAIGENLKRIDHITSGLWLSKHPNADWS